MVTVIWPVEGEASWLPPKVREREGGGLPPLPSQWRVRGRPAVTPWVRGEVVEPWSREREGSREPPGY